MPNAEDFKDLIENDQNPVEEYEDLKEKHLEDDGRADFEDFLKWLYIRQWAAGDEAATVLEAARRRFIQAKEGEENYP